MTIAPQIRVQRLPGTPPDWPLPSYETAGAAGADVRAFLPDGSVTLASLERALVPTGLAFEIPRGLEVQVRPRSGLALKQGVAIVNAPGTIDSDYRGAIGILLVNLGAAPVEISHGMRIAQLVVAPAPQAVFAAAEGLGETARGAGGFGSTGSSG